MKSILEASQAIKDQIIEDRHNLHRRPEFGFDLPETAAYVQKRLAEMGIESQPCGGPIDPDLRKKFTFAGFPDMENSTGVVATIGKGEPCILLRADMDALPIKEETGLPFASRHEGFMHACGHDTHTAMLLGAGKVLWAHKDEIAGTVRLMFQTSEEQSRGAEVMIENGGVEGADAVFGTHIGTIIDKAIPTGTVVVTPGCCMAAFDKFVIKVNGRGCHGSTPEKGIDPVNIAAHIVIALQAITTRELNATKPLVLTIGKIQGGSQYNVIPNEVVIEGTIRTLEEEVRQFAAKRIGEIAQATAAVFGGSVDYEMIWGAPPVINDDKMAALAAKAAKTVAGEDHVITEVKAPNMGGEDFAYYLEKLPGAFMFLSSSNPAKGTDVSHHNPKFDVDEDVLWEGSAVFVAIVEEFLNK